MNPSDLIAVFQRLQIPLRRAEAAQKLAEMVDVMHVLLFVKDIEVDAFLPAIGMPQTLPNGVLWQKFLLACAAGEQSSRVLPAPGENCDLPSFAIVDADKLCILVFVGRLPNKPSLEMIEQLLPLLAGKLTDERVVVAANGHAQAAREATKKAQEFNAALDKKQYQLKEAIYVAEKELAQRRIAENKLLEADRYKNNFLATLAHELRNPLGAISMAVELQDMLNFTPAGAAADAHNTIKRQTTHLINLVNDLLDVARVSQGKITLKYLPVRTGDFIDGALEMTRAIIVSHNHKLDINVADPDLMVMGDETRLAQIVGNLLENAAKYTPKNGEIKLDVANEHHDLVITISDNGIGISTHAREHLFAMFSQSERVDGRVAEGLGLGLTLVKSFVELHGGQISVASEGAGLGSKFTVRIPVGDKSHFLPGSIKN